VAKVVAKNTSSGRESDAVAKGLYRHLSSFDTRVHVFFFENLSPGQQEVPGA
jgi:hypothetical protein